MADAPDPENARLSNLTALVAEGSDVDWAAESTTVDAGERVLIEHLRIVSQVGQYYRDQDSRGRIPAAVRQRTSWGTYKLRGVIGTGSYGTVFRAWNPRLEREVALKLLHGMKMPTDGAALIAEARLLARIRHPNIVMVFDADHLEGCVGLSMEYINGRTLKEIVGQQGAFSGQETAIVGLDLCGALAAVHQADLLHRDIKAQNVMRASGGRIVLMDFGAAAIAATDATRSVVTPLYAPPEVLFGDSPSPQSDLYSLGVLLYYLSSGQFPVTGKDIDDLRDAHTQGRRRLLRDVRPDLPAPFVHAVDQATAPLPEHRPQSAGALEAMLEAALGRRAVAPGAPRTEPRTAPPSSIAVLPFADLSPDHALEFFCDGIAEEITNALTRLPGIRVVAPGSAFRFRDTDGDRSDLSAALNVASVLEGTVRAVGNSLRVVSRLINTADGRVRWSHRFDRSLDDVFAVQDEIAEATVRALGATAGGEVPGAGVLPVAASAHDVEAYTLYLKGRYYWNRRSEAALQKSTALFEAAIERDPQYAEAYAGLAEAHATLGLYGCVAPQDSMPRALRAANHAIKLLDTLSSPFATAACVAAVYDWNWKEGERQFARAIELNPAHPAAHHWYAINFLVPLGRFAEAATELQKAAEADPLSMPIRVSVGMYQYFARRYAEAERELRDGLELDAGSLIGRVFLSLSLVEMGRVSDALRELETARQLGDSYEAIAATGYALARAGHGDAARERADELIAARSQRYISPSLPAQIYAALGETTKALDWLEKASDARAPDLAWLRVRPVFDSLRAEGRLGALTGRLGL